MADANAEPETTNVIAQLVSGDGEPAGPQLELPTGVTPVQLEQVLNGLLQKSEEVRWQD